MCNTQIHVSLFVFHLLILFGGILLEGCILLGAWLPGSFLHFWRSFLMFFLWRYPWHLDWIVDELAPTLSVEFLGYFLLGVPVVLLSYACTVVVSRWLLVSIVHMSEVCCTRVPFGITL